MEPRIEIEPRSLAGTYEEMVDASEDITSILRAACNTVDLTPAFERWLVDLLEEIEDNLARDFGSYRTGTGARRRAFAGAAPTRRRGAA